MKVLRQHMLDLIKYIENISKKLKKVIIIIFE